MSYLLSFDVEDWFHAHNLRPAIGRGEWRDCEHRVVANTRVILDLLEAHDTKATFFVLGWVAEQHPELVRAIDDRGHEVASHGYNHELLYEQTEREVREDIERSLEILSDMTHERIRGYRAPSFSITDWATDILRELQFEYDSSLFSVDRHDRYGGLSAESSGTFMQLPNRLIEASLPQVEISTLLIPWAGGGYFRVVPYPIFRRGIKRIAADRPFIFYLHPWDLDPDQPKLDGIPATYRLRHYTNLDKTKDRLDRLLGDFEWKPIKAGIPEDYSS